MGKLKQLGRSTVSLLLVLAIVVASMSIISPKKASAAPFQTQTGYYVGTGVGGLAISGVGFQPDFVMIRATTTVGVAVFKTSAMPANTIAYTSATAVDTGTNITFAVDGFSVGTLANVNTVNVVYHWIAMTGSDCSATGNYCVGTYTGNGAGNRNITVGFQPSTVVVKRSTAVAGHFRVAAQPANETIYLNQTARETTGVLIRSFAATTFQVGTTDNTNTAVYYYVAFATTASAFTQGTYTGNGVDNRNITGLGFQPDFVLVKNATGASNANRQPVMNFMDSYGDSSSFVGDATTSAVNAIQALQSDGFQVGTAAQANLNTNIYYYFAIRGASSHTTSGNHTIATGSYVGTGAVNSISGLGFRPDLVIIKADTAQLSVFRTRTMGGDSTAHLSSATTNFTGGITALNVGGFSLGTNATVNSAGITYRWQAFGGAYNPYTHSGSTDFAVGAYYGNGIDSRDISRLPWQPNMVAIKQLGTSTAVWRPSSQAGDNTSYFAATAQAADIIQTFNATGFQVGTNTSANTAATIYHWFAFRNSSNFAVGSYSGTGAVQNITSAGFRAENVWLKRSTAVAGVMSSTSVTTGQSQYFTNTANIANRITGYYKNGFKLGGNFTESNATGGTYYYAAWNNPSYTQFGVDIVDASAQSVAAPSFALGSSAFNFNCTSASGTFGTGSQRIQITNISANPNWSLSIAATNGPTDLWRNVGDTEQYDFNDASSSGCSDGGDADSRAGQLTFDSSTSTLGGEVGCGSSGISFAALTAFSQGAVDSVELLSGGSGSDSDCIWELTGINASQTLPAEQPIGSYDINLTLTLVAM